MPSVFIPFDGWSPGDGYFGEGWGNTRNLYPAFGAWRPWHKFAASKTTVVDGPMTGAHVHKWTSGLSGGLYQPDAISLFTGSVSKLYSVDSTSSTFSNLSRAAAYTANPAGWRFCSIGNDIWAANGLDALQRRTNNTGNFADGTVSTFSPKPRFLTTIREHLVVANLSNAGRFQDEIAWSDADDATNFDPATTTGTSLAGSKRLPSIPGQITGLVGGQYGLAFKREGILYLEYAGSPAIFRPDVLSPSIGTGYPGSIITSRYGVYFLGPDGFYVISGLSAPAKVSPLGVDSLLLGNGFFSNYPYAPANLALSAFAAWREDSQCRGFTVPGLPLIGWAFRYDWTNNGNDSAIIYNPVANQWAIVSLAPSPLGGPAPSRPTVFFELPYSVSMFETLQALLWDGTTTTSLAALSGSSVYGPTLQLNFRPANLEKTNQLQQSVVLGVLPVISKTVDTGTRLSPTVTVDSFLDPDSTTITSELEVPGVRNIAGFFPFRTPGRFFRVTIACAEEDFANFEGAVIDQDVLR